MSSPIRPIDMSGVVQRSQEVSQMKHQENNKPYVDNQNFGQHFSKEIRHQMDSVTDSQKGEKKKEQYAKLTEYANQNTKNVDRYKSQAEKDAAYKAAMEKNAKAKPGSIAAKANMVKDYNERNNK